MGTWFDPDGLFRKFGTTKAVPNIAGEYKTYGPLREIEVKFDLTTASTTSTILSDQTFFPKGVFVEEVIAEAQTALVGGTSFSVGLYQSNDRATAISEVAFISAEVTATLAAAGNKVTYVAGTAKAGDKVGTVPIVSTAAFTGMISGKVVGTFTGGVVLVRIRYRAVM